MKEKSVREIWDSERVTAHFEKPFFELINAAYTCHKFNFNIQEMEFCVLSNIKTGGCPENCAYCPQSAHYKTDLKNEKLLDLNLVLSQAKKAKASGANRFCMGAAWRAPPKKDFPKVLDMISEIKNLGLETCATLGMIELEQAKELKNAGLDFYNHNLDTSPDFYSSIITTRTYLDRLKTIKNIMEAGIRVCCGGILGMGESRKDRIEFLIALYELPSPPPSIPINQLMPITGTPLQNVKPIDPFEFIRTIAIARLMFPKAKIRLAAGREEMSDEMQAWCFMAGANSIFIGSKLLTAKNPNINHDMVLLKKLCINTPLFEESQDYVE